MATQPTEVIDCPTRSVETVVILVDRLIIRLLICASRRTARAGVVVGWGKCARGLPTSMHASRNGSDYLNRQFEWYPAAAMGPRWETWWWASEAAGGVTLRNEQA
ncbi:hypothetical protein NW767_015605, partial [Fusarium falciforme]